MKKIDLLRSQLTFLKLHGGSWKEIEELEKKIGASKRGSSSKRKGASYENALAKILMDRFPQLDLVRTPSSGGFQKSSNNSSLRGDISNVNEDYLFSLHIEAKNQKTVSIKKFIAQSESDCPADKIPSVIFHIRQENEGGKRIQQASDYICLTLKDFLSIVKEEAIIKEAKPVKKVVKKGMVKKSVK